MNDLIERGLRTAVSVLADALDSGPVRDMRPQQFDPSENKPRSRRRARQSEEQLEGDSTAEEARQPAIEVQPATVPSSRRAIELRRQLRDRGSVQRAFLLMELLDKPRALRPHQQRQM